jgi:hypothetical protein
MEEDNKGTALGNVIRIDDDRVKEHLDKVVRGTVEETSTELAPVVRVKNGLREGGRHDDQGYFSFDPS